MKSFKVIFLSLEDLPASWGNQTSILTYIVILIWFKIMSTYGDYCEILPPQIYQLHVVKTQIIYSLTH